eukprot:1187653-Prorocentrum_minimum.AAC.3
MDPEAELKRLKVRFEDWKKDFKNKLVECKAVLKKIDKHHPAPHHPSPHDRRPAGQRAAEGDNGYESEESMEGIT